MTLHAPIPALRIFSEAKARECYLDFAGFTLRREHRIEPGLPLYAAARRGAPPPRTRRACAFHPRAAPQQNGTARPPQSAPLPIVACWRQSRALRRDCFWFLTDATL